MGRVCDGRKRKWDLDDHGQVHEKESGGDDRNVNKDEGSEEACAEGTNKAFNKQSKSVPEAKPKDEEKKADEQHEHVRVKETEEAIATAKEAASRISALLAAKQVPSSTVEKTDFTTAVPVMAKSSLEAALGIKLEEDAKSEKVILDTCRVQSALIEG